MNILLQFAPLLIYVVVDSLFGYRAGIIAAFISCAMLLGWNYATTGDIDSISIGETVLIVLMGWVSLKMKSDKYFKFQPTVVAVIFMLILGYFQFIVKKPFFVEYMPHMEKIFMVGQEKDSAIAVAFQAFHAPHMQKVLRRLSMVFIWVFGGHGLIMAYAALHMRTGAWFLWRMAIYPIGFIVTIIVQLTA